MSITLQGWARSREHSQTAARQQRRRDYLRSIVATESEMAELRSPADLVLADATETERAEALAAARLDPDAALTSYRALVAEKGAEVDK